MIITVQGNPKERTFDREIQRRLRQLEQRVIQVGMVPIMKERRKA